MKVTVLVDKKPEVVDFLSPPLVGDLIYNVCDRSVVRVESRKWYKTSFGYALWVYGK